MSKTTPSFLYEVFESESEEEEIEKPGPEEKVAANPNPKLRCFLCGDLQQCCFGLAEVVEASEYTFSDVLTKLFSREQLPHSLAEKDYSQGLLCTYCKYLVSDLFRLQRELKTVKNVIVRTFKDSENKDINVISNDDYETEPILVHKKTNGREKSKDTEKGEKEKTCDEKNQKRKRESLDDETCNGKAEASKQTNHIEEVSTNDLDLKPIKVLKRKSITNKYEVKVKYEDADQSEKSEQYEKEEVYESKNQKRKSLDYSEEETIESEGMIGLSQTDATDEDKDIDDAVYNIEALVAKKGSTYLVKWENYPDSQNTWEPKSLIPDLIVEYYEEEGSRLGKPLPLDFARFENTIEEEDDNIWHPEEDKKVIRVSANKRSSTEPSAKKRSSTDSILNKRLSTESSVKKRLSTESLKNPPMEKGTDIELIDMKQQTSKQKRKKRGSLNQDELLGNKSNECDGIKDLKKEVSCREETETENCIDEDDTASTNDKERENDETINGKAEAKERGERKQSKKFEEASTNWDFKPIKVLKRRSEIKRYEVKIKYEDTDKLDKSEKYKKEEVYESKNQKRKSIDNPEEVYEGKAEALQTEATYDVAKAIEHQFLKQKRKSKGCFNRDELLNKETIESDGRKGIAKKGSFQKENEPENNIVEINTAFTNYEDKDNEDAPVDEAVYNIEALVAKKGSTYLVKWENYPNDQNTWEHYCSIPESIVEHYEADSSRLGKPLPSYFARFGDAVQEEMTMMRDEEEWGPEEDKKVNKVSAKKRSSTESSAKKRLSTESFKYIPMGKEKHDQFKDTKPKPKRRSKKLSLEDKKPKDLNAKGIERLIAKNGPKYLVKWLKQSEDENTWEHKSAIPKDMLKYYERDLSRLGTSPPAMESDIFQI